MDNLVIRKYQLGDKFRPVGEADARAWRQFKSRLRNMWRYGIVKRDGLYGVHEVYGSHLWTEDPIRVIGESRRSIIRQLERMLADCKRHRTIQA